MTRYRVAITERSLGSNEYIEPESEAINQIDSRGIMQKWEDGEYDENYAYDFDFDGVLCRDRIVDEQTYEESLVSAEPLYLPKHARLIVTGRHIEHYNLSAQWLERHGVTFDRMVMRDFEITGDFVEQVAYFKAQEYKASDCMVFVESDYNQAERINQLSGKAVLCPGKAMFPPIHLDIRKEVQETLAIKTCKSRSTEGCGCGGMARCARGKGRDSIVYYPDCLACIKAGEADLPGGTDDPIKR